MENIKNPPSEAQLAWLYELLRCHPEVTTDSRNVPGGSIFFALRGANFDGNAYADAALEKGAAYAVVDDPCLLNTTAAFSTGDDTARPAVSSDSKNSSCCPGSGGGLQNTPPPAAVHRGRETLPGKFILVPDVLSALQALAALHRRTLGIPVLAITGTNGKTTTKELTAAVLSRKYNVTATAGNLNNHIGVPLTLLTMTASTQIAVIEMGASAREEIALLCNIAAPDYGLITNIGRAHLEGFGSEEGVRQAKGELYDYLASTGGTALVREDDPVLVSMAGSRHGLHAEFYPSLTADGFQSNLEGDYNRFNIAAAVAAGRMLGIPEDDIRSAIRDYMPSNNRSQRIDTPQGNILIADFYNANPSSMKAALENFFKTATDSRGRVQSGRHYEKTVILGEMLELGGWSLPEHREVLRLVSESGIRRAYFVGAAFDALAEKTETGFLFFPDTGSLLDHLRENPLRESLILLKGSRKTQLEKALPLL